MKKTALHNVHIKHGAKMIQFAGYDMPLEYAGVVSEHLAVRNSAGIFDVSHMGKFWIKGDYAADLLQKITTNDVLKLREGQAQYTCIPNKEGGIVDDIIIYKYDKKKFFVVVNASNISKDWNWITKHNTIGAEIENSSEKISILALQGPKAREILQQVTSSDLQSIGSFEFVTTKVGQVKDVIVSATGYTGAGGFELYCYDKDAVALWELIMKTGSAYNIQPAGLAARDTLRIEMGYCLYGNDIDDSTSPIEAGLGWVVKLNENNNFDSKELFSVQKKNGVVQKLVGIELIGRGIPRSGYVIVDEKGGKLGTVTSGTMSPVLKKGIGMGYVKSEYADVGTIIFVQIRNKNIEARISKLPFITK